MKTYWRATAAVVALMGALTLGALLPATPGHTQVARTVVRVRQNGPDDAVPVTLQGTSAISGSVNVVNTPNVNVANTPNVNVVSLPAVQVNSSVASPLFTRNVNDAVQPIHLLGTVVIPGGSFGGNADIAPPVPGDRRLVIEYASVHTTLPAAQRLLTAEVATRVGGVGLAHEIPILNGGALNAALAEYAGGQAMRAYADPGTLVNISAVRGPATGNQEVYFELSGYLTPVP